MPPTPSRLRRALLRTIVLVQLVVLAMVAYTTFELLSFGAEVTPGTVAMVAVMLACTVVALRATFRGDPQARGHRLFFMSAQAVATLAPLVGRSSLFTIVAPGSLLPPDEMFGPQFVIGTMGLALLAAAMLAGTSALLAPLLLTPLPQANESAPFSRSLRAWGGGAMLAAAVACALYAAHFAERRQPVARVKQLLEGADDQDRWIAARNLVALDLSAQPQLRAALFEGLHSPTTPAQAWAAYVLVASASDDGRAMTYLRDKARSFGSGPAVRSLALLGDAAAPAVGELTTVIDRPTGDAIDAEIQTNAANALAAIGSDARGAINALVDRMRELDHPELRSVAAQAIDRIDPDYAKRCFNGATTMTGALAIEHVYSLTIRPECQRGAVSPSEP